MAERGYPSLPFPEGTVTYQYRVVWEHRQDGRETIPRVWGRSRDEAGWISGNQVPEEARQAREQLIEAAEIWVERRMVTAWERLEGPF
jgi:hypothetical protein